MEEFVVLKKSDMKNLKNDKPIKVRLFDDDRIFTLCTEEYFKKEVMKEGEEE